jgi:phosphotransferase system HPr (HPr) family protein
MKTSKRCEFALGSIEARYTEYKPMFPRASFLSGTSALDIALQNKKPKSLLTRCEVKIINKLGLHARPAAEFVRAANIFRSKIWIIKGEKRFSARSIIEVLTANLNCGDTAIIEAQGTDSESAIAVLAKLVSRFSDEDSECGSDGL